MAKVEHVDKINEKLDTILQDVNTLKVGVEENKSEIGQLKASVQTAHSLVDGLQKDVTTLRKDKSTSDQFVMKEKVFQEQIKSLEQKIVDMETYSRRENLIFYGVPEDKGEDLQKKVMDVIVHRLNIPDARL